MLTKLLTYMCVSYGNLKSCVVTQTSSFHVADEVRKELKEKEISLTLCFLKIDNPSKGLSETIHPITDLCKGPQIQMPQDKQETQVRD